MSHPCRPHHLPPHYQHHDQPHNPLQDQPCDQARVQQHVRHYNQRDVPLTDLPRDQPSVTTTDDEEDDWEHIQILAAVWNAIEDDEDC
mmetsp:Transcript_20880/g.33307  ORF Transcript_20880/g.33307 Transcript_20880/m.33307 type:complete len:88 (-) Transcript_20880:1214-1477(-)